MDERSDDVLGDKVMINGKLCLWRRLRVIEKASLVEFSGVFAGTLLCVLSLRSGIDYPLLITYHCRFCVSACIIVASMLAIYQYSFSGRGTLQ